MQTPGARITMFGPFSASLEGRRVAFARRGAERLLAYLALNGVSDRVGVALALWPEARRDHALASLRQAIRAVATAGCESWVEAHGTTLALGEHIETDLPSSGEPRETGATLLDGWDDEWLDPHRARWSGAGADSGREGVDLATARATEALFDLMAWYGDRSPETALRLAVESEPLFALAAPAQLTREVAPILAHFDRLPEGSGNVSLAVARAHYLTGRMGPAFDLYGRIASEFDARRHSELVAHARLAQIVVLRESGASREAAHRAAAFADDRPASPFFRWAARYHLGYTRYLAGEVGEGFAMARAAVESDVPESAPIARLFPLLNVAEGLIDGGQTFAARGMLGYAWSLARAASDPLGLMTANLLDVLLVAREGGRVEALRALVALEDRAWEAKLVPFAALVDDRAAVLATDLGKPEQAQGLLRRADRIRAAHGLRRAPVERMRLAAAGL